MAANDASAPEQAGSDSPADRDYIETIIKLVENHLLVWKEADPDKRLVLAKAVYKEDIQVTDPGVILTGYAEVSDFIGQLLQNNPGFVFRMAEPIEAHHNTALLSWQFGPLPQPDLITGKDVFSITEGRISSILVFVAGTTDKP